MCLKTCKINNREAQRGFTWDNVDDTAQQEDGEKKRCFKIRFLLLCSWQAGAQDDQGDGNEGAGTEQGQDPRQGGKED